MTPCVDKYLTVVMIFMFLGIPIAFISPTTGEIRDPPFLPLFYGSIAGLIIIMLYSSYQERRRRDRARSERRSKK